MLNTKSPALDPTIAGELIRWPPCRPLDGVPPRYEVEQAIRTLANRKAVGPDGLPVELMSGPTKENRTRSESFTRSLSPCGEEVECHHDGIMQRSRWCTRRNIGRHVASIVAFLSWLTPATFSSTSLRVALVTTANARTFCRRNNVGLDPSARRLA